MSKVKSNPLYILVRNPDETRKHVLLSALDTIKVVERYETFRKLKNYKRKKFVELSEILKHIDQNLEKFTDVLPELRERKIEKQITKIEKKDVELVAKKRQGK